MNFDSGLETFALVSVCRITCRIDDRDIKVISYFIFGSYVAQAFQGLWTLVVETTGEIVGDRQTVGFFFHFCRVYFICGIILNMYIYILYKSRTLF